MSDKKYEELSDENNSYNDWDLYKGILYSFISGFFSSLTAVIVKYLDDIHPGELAVFRYIVILLLTVPMVIRNGGNPFGPSELRHILIMRGIAGATALYLKYFAFRYLLIADATVIIYSVPVFVSIFACIFLKESCGIFETLTVLLTMLGLTLTTKMHTFFAPEGLFDNSTTNYALKNMSIESPNELVASESSHHIYGVLSALSAMLCVSFVFILIRKAKVIMFNYVWVGVLESVTITALMDGFSVPKNLTECALIMLLGMFSFCDIIFVTRSLQLEQASPCSVVKSATDIVLVFLWQLWLLNDIPDSWSITGAFLVTVCILITTAKKWILALPQDSKIKSKFEFMIYSSH